MPLGLGVAGMGGKNPEVFNHLKQALLRLGCRWRGGWVRYGALILLGTADTASAGEMHTYAQEIQHRRNHPWGLAVGVGFIYYGHQEEADETIQLKMFVANDSLNRYSLIMLL